MKKQGKNFFFYGAGSKAVTCDENTQGILSLSKGVVSNNCKIIGYTDVNRLNSENAVLKFGGEVFESVYEVLRDNKNIHVVISTPDHLHFQHVMESIKQRPASIIAEKPLALTSLQAHEIVTAADMNDIKITVNYFRRFLPSYTHLQRKIQKKQFGKFLFGRGLYDKGLLHNGSHLVNLLLFFFGEISVDNVGYRKKSTIINNYNYGFDLIAPTYDGGRIQIQCGNEYFYTLFELELYFENKMVKIHDFGRFIEYYSPSPDSISGYVSLKKDKTVETEYMKSAYYTIKAHCNNMDQDGIKDAVRAIEIYEEIVEMYENLN